MFHPWLLALMLLAGSAQATGRKPPDAPWTTLLRQHVSVVDDGHASRVDYAGMRRDRAALDAYTRQLSSVTAAEFQDWNRADQMAFLINAYNAFTVQLILSRWPDVSSIKDLGGLFSSPWKRRFFSLLDRPRSLDEIEDMLRAPGRYDDPRIHFAINCASIGCPMLQPFAFDGADLGRQLDKAVADFLGDRSRNRYDSTSAQLELSRIFDWYAGDFSHGPDGSVAGFLAAHAASLSDDPRIQLRLREQRIPVRFLPYDWRLNGTRPADRQQR